MLTSYGPSPSSKQEIPGLKNLRTIAPLRAGAGLVLFFFYALGGAVQSYKMIWKHEPWALVPVLQQAHVPYPDIVASVAVGVALIVSVAWVTGFLTRFLSLVFMPVIIGALVVVERLNAEAHAGVCWLFFFITLTLVMYGSGLVSVDALFHLGSRPKKRKGY